MLGQEMKGEVASVMRRKRWLSLYAMVALLLLATGATALECNSTVAEQAEIARWSLLSGLTFSRDSHAAAAFADQIWLVGGVSASYYTKRLEYTTTRSDVVASSDGEQWTEVLEEAPFRRRYGHSLLAFTDASDGVERLTLLAGFSPEPATDIWVTTDGTAWTEVSATVATPWAGRGYHCSVVFDQQLWVLGGSPMNNDVWATSSVLTGAWQQQSDVPWTPRAAQACASHQVVTNVTLGDASRQEFLYLLGGWRDTSLNDVWRMDTSGHWESLLESAPWEPRAWLSVVSFDSRTSGDVQLGPRLWLLGGGIVGNGIEKMIPFSDVWYTRDGVEWVAASSDASGVSTAEWSMLSQRDSDVCLGKWGHVVVPFHRSVTRAFYCHESCMTENSATSLKNQLIAVCDPTTGVPDEPAYQRVLKGNAVLSMMLYPDGCGLCPSDSGVRYVNTTQVPALFLIAGNVGSQKVNDVFRSSNGMLCEKDGEICSSQGVCVLGGSCLCNAGKTGPLCESDLDYTIVDSTSCFPESARLVTPGGKTKRMGDVRVGDAVLALDAAGQLTFSTVYYIPHESQRHTATEFIRVEHDGDSSQLQLGALELTPDHLVYHLPGGESLACHAGACDVTTVMARLAQKPAHELRPNDTLLVVSPRQFNKSSDQRVATTWLSTLDASVGASTASESASDRVVAVRVVRLRRVKRRGALTLYTGTGNLFVNGVLCSNFGDHYPLLPGATQRRDLLAFGLFAPHRWAFALFPRARTAELLRALMDQLVLPALKWCRTPLRSKLRSWLRDDMYG